MNKTDAMNFVNVIEDISQGQREARRLHRASFGITQIADFEGERPLEAAKAAAQADFETRVLACLETTKPAPDGTGCKPADDGV